MFSKKLNVQETDELASPRMRQKFSFIEGTSANAVRSDPSYKTTNKTMTVLLKIVVSIDLAADGHCCSRTEVIEDIFSKRP